MNTENRHNYYEILEITENATQQEIHLAYEKAKMTYSSENKALNSVFSVSEASELRTLIEEAYEVLSNNTYRNIYEKRMLANTFAEDELTVEAIKIASEDLFQKAAPPQIVIETANQSIVNSDFENELAKLSKRFNK